MRVLLVAVVLVAASGALPLTGDGAAASLLDEPHKEHTLGAETAAFSHDQEQQFTNSDTFRGVFREDESVQVAHELAALERTNDDLGESFSGSDKEEERHAKAAERKAEQAADKAMHSINKMEKDVDARAKLKQDMAKVREQAKQAQKSANKQVRAITHHELGESPSKALREAKKEEAKALHKIEHMENSLDAQARITSLKAKQMKDVAKEVQSITKHAANAAKQSEKEAAKLDKQESNDSAHMTALGESPSSEKARANAAMKKAEEEAKKATAHIRKLEKDLKTQATLKKDMSKFAAQASSALKSAHHAVSSVKGDDVLGEGQQKNADDIVERKDLDEEEVKATKFEKETMNRFENLESAFVRKAKAVEQNHQAVAAFKKAAATATHLKAGKSGTDLGDSFDAENTEDTLSKMASSETARLIQHTDDALAKFSEATSDEIKAIVS